MIESPGFNPNIVEGIRKETESSVHFRIATEKDIEVLIPLVNRAYMYESEGRNAFKQRDVLRTDNEEMRATLNDGIIIVATNPQTDEIFGCVQYNEIPASAGSGSDQDTNAYFGSLAVDPALQGRGFGLRLLKIAEEIGKARGKSAMEIQVVSHSTHLLDYYGRLGS